MKYRTLGKSGIEASVVGFGAWVLVSGGERISTVEMEAAIDSHPAPLEMRSFGVPHEKRERPKLSWCCALAPRRQRTKSRRAEDSRDRFAYGGVEAADAEISVRGPKYVVKKGKTPPAIRRPSRENSMTGCVQSTAESPERDVQ